MGKQKQLRMERRAEPEREEEKWLAELVGKYLPSTPRDVLVRMDGTEDEFEARMFQSWVNGRDIPIEELCLLFNRDAQTIRRWQSMNV